MSVCALAKDVAFGGPYMRSTSLRVVLSSMMFRSTALASCDLRTSFPPLAHPVVATAAVTRAAATQIVLETIPSLCAYRRPCCAACSNHAAFCECSVARSVESQYEPVHTSRRPLHAGEAQDRGRDPEGGLRDPEGEPRRGGRAEDHRRIGAALGHRTGPPVRRRGAGRHVAKGFPGRDAALDQGRGARDRGQGADRRELCLQ